jgi:hypothetical protein
MTVLESTFCCAVGELDHLGFSKSPQEALKDIGGHYWHSDERAFIFFTEVRRKGRSKKVTGRYGEKLKAYIKKHKLGTVIATDTKKNVNSGNHVRMYVWTVNKTNFKKWCKLHNCYNNFNDWF